MGFQELKKNTINSIYFIPEIYYYGVCLLTLVHFRDPIIKICPLVAKYLVKNGVSRIFWKKKKPLAQLISFNHYGVSLFAPIYFCLPSINFGPQFAKFLAKNDFF